VDASTLIYVAKAGAFDGVARCVETLAVPPAVWEESVVAGERIGAAEVGAIRAAEGRARLRRVRLQPSAARTADRIAAEHRLGRGESEVLALALAQDRVAVIDEGRATRVAQALGLLPISTLFLPLVGRRRGSLARDAALDLLRRLAAVTGARADAVFAIERVITRERE
jgi:predicted nucleic acid-binding protein